MVIDDGASVYDTHRTTRAFELGLHVLVVLVDMTNYCEALRDAAAHDEVSGRRGYPRLHVLRPCLAVRTRRTHPRRPGTVTQLPVLSMPDDDVTHPVLPTPGHPTAFHRSTSKQPRSTISS